MKYPENYIEVQQNTPEWLKMRCGLVTGSKAYDVVAERKRVKEGEEPKPLAGYVECLGEMVFEIMTGLTAEKYVSYWMKRGIELEPIARQAYEIDYNREVDTRIGFILHPRIKMCGYSPDGLVGDDGMVEFKVPAPATHWRYIWAGVTPPEYIPQMNLGLACSGRKWCDFMSHNPDMPREFQNFTIRHLRDEAVIEDMEKKVEKFLAEVDAAVQAFRKKMKGAKRTQEETE